MNKAQTRAELIDHKLLVYGCEEVQKRKLYKQRVA